MSGVKLTKAQREVLKTLGDPYVVCMSQSAMGAHGRTMGSLLRHGLIEQEPPAKIVWNKHTFFRITPAGRLALSQGGGE